jgi:hypothetical protein
MFAGRGVDVCRSLQLEEITAKPIKKKLQPVELWQMKNSNIEWFVIHEGKIRLRGEGYEW